MILEMAGGLVSGGINALQNITGGIGKGISRIGSTFFPTPQQPSRIESNTVQQANFASVPYPKTQQAATLYETSPWQHWNDPSAFVGPPAPTLQEPSLWQNISSALTWAGTQAPKVRTIVDQFDPPKPATPTNTGAGVIQMAKTGAGALWEQAKGLFNLGFPQQKDQPAFGITHQVSPSPGLSTGLIIAGVVLVVVLLIMRKK